MSQHLSRFFSKAHFPGPLGPTFLRRFCMGTT